MRFIFRHVILSCVPFIFVFAATANASVSLSFTNNGATPGSVTVSAGSSFPVQIKVVSSTASATDTVTSVDYYLQASISNVFKILSRNTQTDGSAFGFTDSSDSFVATAPAGPGLNPSNSTDLGGSQTNVTDPPISNTTAIVADYVISVASNAATGAYTIGGFEQSAGVGYSNAGPSFAEQTFASLGSYSVTVTPAPNPEPATAGLLAIAGIAGLCRRRRRNVSLAGANA